MVYVFRMVRKDVVFAICCWILMFYAAYKSKQRHSKTGSHAVNNEHPTPQYKRSYNALRPVVVWSKKRDSIIPYKSAIRSPYIGLGGGSIYKINSRDRALLKKKAWKAFVEKLLRESPAVDKETGNKDFKAISREDGVKDISQHYTNSDGLSEKNEKSDAKIEEVSDQKMKQEMDADNQRDLDLEPPETFQGQGQRDWKLEGKQPDTLFDPWGEDSKKAEWQKDKKTKKKKVKTKRAEFLLIDPRFEVNLDRKRAKMKFSIEPDIIDEISCDDEISQRCYHDMGVNFTVVSFIPTIPRAKARRQMLRETVGSVKYVDGARYVTLFVVGHATNDVENRAIEPESRKFGDILRYDRLDSYINLPLKTLAILQWSAEHLPPHYLIIKMDDDVARSHVRITQLVGDVIRNRSSVTNSKGVNEVLQDFPIICGNWIFEGVFANRAPANKWFISRSSYSINRWPRACAGPMYLLSARRAAKLYEVSRNTAMIALEDMWVTGVLRIKLGEGDTNIMASGYSNSKMFGFHIASTSTLSRLPDLRLQAAHSFQMLALNASTTCLCVRKRATNAHDETLTPPTIKIRANKLV